MSKSHRNPTISFHIADWEREEIEAKIIASGLSKRDYFARSCIYNRVCVVGKKELIYKLVQELQTMQMVIKCCLSNYLLLNFAHYLPPFLSCCPTSLHII